jgi:hypothetical protein
MSRFIVPCFNVKFTTLYQIFCTISDQGFNKVCVNKTGINYLLILGSLAMLPWLLYITMVTSCYHVTIHLRVIIPSIHCVLNINNNNQNFLSQVGQKSRLNCLILILKLQRVSYQLNQDEVWQNLHKIQTIFS